VRINAEQLATAVQVLADLPNEKVDSHVFKFTDAKILVVTTSNPVMAAAIEYVVRMHTQNMVNMGDLP
jgi:hypothetical protein